MTSNEVIIQVPTRDGIITPMDITEAIMRLPGFDIEDLEAVVQHLRAEINRMAFKATKKEEPWRC